MNKDRRKNNGGLPGTGRNKLPEGQKAVSVAFYAYPSEIELLGGIKEARAKMKACFKKEVIKAKK